MKVAELRRLQREDLAAYRRAMERELGLTDGAGPKRDDANETLDRLARLRAAGMGGNPENPSTPSHAHGNTEGLLPVLAVLAMPLLSKYGPQIGERLAEILASLLAHIDQPAEAAPNPKGSSNASAEPVAAGHLADLSGSIIAELSARQPHDAAEWLTAQRDQIWSWVLIPELHLTPDDQRSTRLAELGNIYPSYRGLAEWLLARPEWVQAMVHHLRDAPDGPGAPAIRPSSDG